MDPSFCQIAPALEHRCIYENTKAESDDEIDGKPAEPKYRNAQKELDFFRSPISYSMVVLYIRDHEDLYFLTKKLTRNQPHNTFMVPWQYWLGITQKHLRCKKGASNKLQVPGTQCKKTAQLKRKNNW